MEDPNDIKAKFAPFTKSRLLSDRLVTNLKLCQSGAWNSVLPTDVYTASDFLVSGLLFKKSTVGRVILQNGNYRVAFQDDGNLVLQKDTAVYWSSGTHGTGASVGMQWDGNLIIFNSTDGVLWSSGTNNNEGARVQLTSEGVLQIINTTGGVIRRLAGDVRRHLENTFYDNSPNALFSDKKGRFFKFEWVDFEHGRVINDIDSKSGTYNRFRGWYRDDTNHEWDVRETDTVHNPLGYITISNGERPTKEDTNDNYNSEQDRAYFFSDSGDRSGMILGSKIRKPFRFPTGGSEKSNYIPGYIRNSIVDCESEACSHRFLVMNRGGTRWNQAFVLYQKYHSKTTFANSIIENHPDLIKNIKKYFNMPETTNVP
jgi:hypothetical protein